jgi:hypothetical protein
MKNVILFSLTALLCVPIYAAFFDDNKQQVATVFPYFKDQRSIATIKMIMDEVQKNGRCYDDYSNRSGVMWSDVEVTTAEPSTILWEFNTEKATEVGGKLQTQKPVSVLDSQQLKTIFENEVFPPLFKAVRAWTDLPDTVFAQIFLQRCCASDAMDWHQDPGEDYAPQANYSLVLMLSEKDDPEQGWTGGEFKIKPGLQDEPCEDTQVKSIEHRYNQGIIFNNQINSHAVSAIASLAGKTAKRDIIVIPFHMTQLPVKKG